MLAVWDVYVRKLFITPFRKYLYLKSDECKHNVGPVFTCSNRKLSVKKNMTIQWKKNLSTCFRLRKLEGEVWSGLFYLLAVK